MAKVMRDYTLVLTIQVKAEEDENEINHDWLYEELERMFPANQGRRMKVMLLFQQISGMRFITVIKIKKRLV